MVKLTVELEKGENGEVAICFDKDGLEILLSNLLAIKSNPGHVHLMTPGWGGDELTEKSNGGADYILINSLRLVHLKDPTELK